MVHQPARIEYSAHSDEAWLSFGWAGEDGHERTTIRLPLTQVLEALSRDLHLSLALLPTGIIALNAEVLEGAKLGETLATKCLPHAPLATLARAMLDLVTEVPDPSDTADLEELVRTLEGAARDVRNALNRSKTSR